MTFDRTSAVAVAHVLAVAVEFLLEWSLHVQFIVIVSARVQVRVSQKGGRPLCRLLPPVAVVIV